jgi:hypothetical protein
VFLYRYCIYLLPFTLVALLFHLSPSSPGVNRTMKCSVVVQWMLLHYSNNTTNPQAHQDMNGMISYISLSLFSPLQLPSAILLNVCNSTNLKKVLIVSTKQNFDRTLPMYSLWFYCRCVTCCPGILVVSIALVPQNPVSSRAQLSRIVPTLVAN